MEGRRSSNGVHAPPEPEAAEVRGGDAATDTPSVEVATQGHAGPTRGARPTHAERPSDVEAAADPRVALGATPVPAEAAATADGARIDAPPAPFVAPGLERPIAPHAVPVAVLLLAIAAATFVLGYAWVSAIAVLLAAGNVAFFRNPTRRIPGGEHRVVSPADGVVKEVVEMNDPTGHIGRAVRIAIFLSVFDVHINRAPLAGRVVRKVRSGTRFLPAFRPEASTHNVQLRMDMIAERGQPLSVVQLTGLVATRIVCYPPEGASLSRGAPYGLICYGSRVELYLPATTRVCVSVGDVVRGGATVLAELSG
jgi:phosphatidylserine decarboxylase